MKFKIHKFNLAFKVQMALFYYVDEFTWPYNRVREQVEESFKDEHKERLKNGKRVCKT